MTATEEFAAFVARRREARAAQDASHISWRKATLPGSAPSDPAGYIARNGEIRAYARPVSGGGYEYGRLVVDDVVPILRIAGTVRTLHDAKTAAFELVREEIDEKEEPVSATAEKDAKKTAEATVEKTEAQTLRDGLMEKLREAIPDAEVDWNKTKRYETFKVDGKAIGLVFAAGARTVQVKISAAFRDVRVPAAANLKKSQYGLMGSISKTSSIGPVVKAFAAAAVAARPAEGGDSK